MQKQKNIDAEYIQYDDYSSDECNGEDDELAGSSSEDFETHQRELANA